MKRPIGLILSAIVLSLVALVLLLAWPLSWRFPASSPHISPLSPLRRHFILYRMLAIGAFYAVLTVWAILTVIGILRLRSMEPLLHPDHRWRTRRDRPLRRSLHHSQPPGPRTHASTTVGRPSHRISDHRVHGWGQSPVCRNRNLVAHLLQPPFHPRSYSRTQTLVLQAPAFTIADSNRTPTAVTRSSPASFSSRHSAACSVPSCPSPPFLLGFILSPTGSHIMYLCFAALMA